MPAKKAAKEDFGTYGVHNGSYDLERWGIFAEMMYLHGMGMTAVPLYAKDERVKGRQLFPGFPKWKTELQDCYFDHEFKRLFIGEALNSVYKRDAKARLESKAKFRTPAGIVPPEVSKLHSSPGDFYGTFGGIVSAFDPRMRKGKETAKDDKKPVMTRPGKKGGPGVADITINKFPEWMPEKYDRKPKVEHKVASAKGPFKSGNPGAYFEPNPYLVLSPIPTYKKLKEIEWVRNVNFIPPHTSMPLDGMKEGCFSKYPEHSADKYFTQEQIARMMKKGDKTKSTGVFKPNGTGKTWPIYSVANLNVDFKTNVKNYRRMKPITYTREFLHDIEF